MSDKFEFTSQEQKTQGHVLFGRLKFTPIAIVPHRIVSVTLDLNH